MKKTLGLLLLCISFFYSVSAQKDKKTSDEESKALAVQEAYIDSVEHAMNYQHGTILLKNGIAKITIPAGFKFLNAEQANFVVTDLWGNPPQELLGMILPEGGKVTDGSSYSFIIQWDEMGFVKDDDADDINYDDLLADMQEDITAGNEERVKEGYGSVKLVGWAAKPFYDKEHKVLHWAKEIKFDDSAENTLNYNIRILGRKGVLILNAVGGMSQLTMVNNDISKVLNIVEFTDGNKYKDFDPGLDVVAAVGIGGLVAGKVLAKLGFLGLLGKFFLPLLKLGKLGIVAIGAGLTAVWRFITGKRKEDETVASIEEESTENTSTESSENA